MSDSTQPNPSSGSSPSASSPNAYSELTRGILEVVEITGWEADGVFFPIAAPPPAAP